MLLSVCIPTFNRLPFLRCAVSYWLEQMAPLDDRVELIIADNASPDGTAAWLTAQQAVHDFRFIERPCNLDFNLSTHDLVAQQARGDYIWVCGDDDYLQPGGLAQVIAALKANPGQDHFSIGTQFIPHDHAPDVTRSDPRLSPHARRTSEPSSRPLARTAELLEFDAGSFTGFYSSIWRRAQAIEALSGEFYIKAPFETLESTLPYGVFIARHRLDMPCYRITGPILTVVHSISWPQYASLFRLKIMPELHDLLEKQGVSPTVLKSTATTFSITGRAII